MNERQYQRREADFIRIEALMQTQFGVVVQALEALEKAMKQQEITRERQSEIEARCDELQAKIHKLKKECKIG